MIKYLATFVVWFIASLFVYLYTIWNISVELFPLILIGLIVVAIISYLPHKIHCPIAFGGIALSTIIVFYIVI